MDALEYDIAYLGEQIEDNKKFSRRFGIAFSEMFPPGAAVLDFGCGHGALSMEAARTAASVLGIDLDPRRIGFADTHTRQAFPELSPKVAFALQDACELSGSYDVIVSKDTLEHVAKIEETFAALARLLKPGGKAYIGFSPLWHSPFGDHGFLTGMRIPWAHLFLGEKRFVKVHNSYTGRPDRTAKEAGYNGAAPEDFYSAIRRSGLIIERAMENAAEGKKQLLMQLFNLCKNVPLLRKYCTVSLYLTLAKPTT